MSAATLMAEYSGDGPGASVLVVRDGRAVLRESYGLADVEERVPATPETNYRLASVSKQFTAAAILTLVEDAKLRLDDRVKEWLPSLPAAADAIAIRHLLTHTSGLIDYEALECGSLLPLSKRRQAAALQRQLRDADVLRLLESQDRTYFPPGTGYRYSNSGYALLALIVERASGQSFASFLRERVFEPLGMRNTVAGLPRSNRAFGYTDGRRTDQDLTSAVLGDGGIYSNIDDLRKWDAALYDERFGIAFRPHTDTDDAEVRYGFGWRITGDTLWHSGETVGFRNVIVRYPARRLTVVVLTNRNAPPPYPTALALAKLYQ